MDESSPFPHQGPLPPELVGGRDEMRRELAERLTERRLTALLGPRRYGKTSVLRRVTADLAAVGPETVWVDLYELSSMADLAGALDVGLAAVRGPVRAVLDDLAGGVSLRLGMVGVELTRSRRERPDPVLVVRSLLRVLVRAAQTRDLIVVFDEFSGIAGVKGAAGLVRTELQHHYRDLGIAFAGSQPSTMRMLFSDRAQPFFAQADLLEIGPLRDAEVTALVEDGFTRTGRSAGDVVDKLVALAQGHPQRAMQMADAVWRATGPGGTADDDAWSAALADVREGVDAGLERLYALLPPGRQRALRIVAGGGSLFGTAADVVELGPGSAQNAVEVLMDNGDVVRTDGRYRIVDPFFADWLRRRFPV